MIVAPNSPSPRAKASASPAASPLRESGRTTRENVFPPPAPRLRDRARLQTDEQGVRHDRARELRDERSGRDAGEDRHDRENEEAQRGRGSREHGSTREDPPRHAPLLSAGSAGSRRRGASAGRPCRGASSPMPSPPPGACSTSAPPPHRGPSAVSSAAASAPRPSRRRSSRRSRRRSQRPPRRV